MVETVIRPPRRRHIIGDPAAAIFRTLAIF